MSETYGGSPQPLYPTISNAKRMALGGHQHRFVYPTLKRNPEVPLIPGSVGLLCRALSEVPWGPLEVKLVVGIGEAMWAYMGNYTTTKTESLSKEEWNSLSDHVSRFLSYHCAHGQLSACSLDEASLGKGHSDTGQIRTPTHAYLSAGAVWKRAHRNRG